MKKIRVLALALVGIVLAGTAGASPVHDRSHANFAIDLHPVLGLTSPIDSVGFGFDARGGYALKLAPSFSLVPEGVLGYTWFGTGIDNLSVGLFRFMGGARARFDLDGVRPAAFFHFGVGSAKITETFQNQDPFGGLFGNFGQPQERSESSATAVLDVGGSIDFDITDNFSLGGHVAFNLVTAYNTPTYMVFGVQGNFGL